MSTDRYRVLQVLYDIVRDKPHPLQYHCSTRELFLRLKGDWQQEYLEELAREKLIERKRTSGIIVLITDKGLEKARKAFKNNMYNKNPGSLNENLLL